MMLAMERSIRQVSYADILHAEGAQALLSAYAEECSIPEIGSPEPQEQTYAALEQLGTMHCFGAYQDSRLVGFASVLNAVLPHYGKRVATVESIYITPEGRGALGRPLLLAIEDHAKSLGCAVVLYSAPADSRFAQLLSHDDEYRHTNCVFCRRVA